MKVCAQLFGADARKRADEAEQTRRLLAAAGPGLVAALEEEEDAGNVPTLKESELDTTLLPYLHTT